MSGIKGRERLQPSLLDRLIDHDPARKKDAPNEQFMTASQLRQAVIRDLAALLSTSNLTTLIDLSSAPLAAASTLNFGIPGFAGVLESSAPAYAMEHDLAEAIRRFEPRIDPDTLVVRSCGAREDSAIPALIFEISGELWGQPIAQQVFFETTIEVETRAAKVAEMRNPGTETQR
jgi:type VI secretion system protein ImpF